MASEDLYDRLPGEGFDSSRLLRTLIDSLPDYVFVKDTNSRFLINNAEHLLAIGVARQEEVVGKTDFDVFPRELAVRYYEDEQKVIGTGRPLVDVEEPITGGSGDRKWLSTTKVPLRDDKGGVVGLLGVSRDITARKVAEEALRKSNARFRAIFDTAAIGIALVDAEGRLIDSNPALQKMLGYDGHELRGIHFADVTYPNDLETDTERFEQLVAGRLDSFHLEKRYTRKDGSVMWGRLTSSAVLGADGGPWFMVGMVEDITERKEAQEAAERLGLRNELLLNSAGEGIYGLDLDEKGVFVNPAASAMLGYSPEELVGQHQHALIHHSYPDGSPYPEEECPILATLKDGAVHRRDDEVFWRKDGTSFPVEYSSTPIYESGELAGAVVSFRDITRRKTAQEALRRSEERYRTVVEAQTELVCRFRPDKNLTFVNEAYCRYFGRKREELIGHSFMEHIPDEDRHIYEEPRFSLDQENPMRTVEHRVFTPEGEIRWQQWSDRAIFDEDGRLVECQSVGRDVTERKLAEEALTESEERYRAVVEQSVESIYLYDVETMRVLESNVAFRKLIGYTADELVGMEIYDFIAHNRDDVDANVRRSLRERKRYIGERTYRRKDGSEFVVDTSATVVPYGGRTAVCAISRDLTERKRAEEQLRQSEERYRRLVELSPEMIAVHSEGTVVFVNGAGAEFLGASSPAEVIGKPMMDFVHPNYRKMVRSRVRQTERENRITPLVQEKFLRLDGRSVDVEVVSAPITYLGKPATQVVARNITDRTEAEKMLRDSEERYRAVVEQTIEGIYLGDAESKRVLESNASFQAMLGYSAEEIRGMHIYDFIAHDSYDIDAVFQSILDAGYLSIGERRYRRKDGSIVDVETSATVISYGDRRALCTVVRDVTERKRAEEQLRESEERYRAAEEGSLDAFFLFRSVRNEAGDIVDFVFMDLNSRAEELISTPAEAVVGTKLCSVLPVICTDGFLEKYARVVETGEALEEEFRVNTPEIRASWLHHQVVPVGDGVAITSRDITERKTAEARLREAENRYRMLVEQIPAVTYIREVGNVGNPRYISPQMEDMLGYKPEECTSDPEHFIRILHPDDRERVLEEWRRIDETGEHSRMEYRQIAKDGRVVWVRDEASLVRDDEVSPLYWQSILTDITERKTLEERLRHQAFHDSLTGLPNRALFLELLDNALARAERDGSSVAVLFVDLDNFKLINDSLGHSKGNELLQLVAEKLRTCARPGDTVARIFGDEFAVLLEDIRNANEATEVASRITEKLRAPFVLNGREIFISASVGIDFGTAGNSEPQELLRNADLAMYVAKRRGKAQHETFAPSMNSRTIERMDLESDLRRAVEKGEFTLLYQPIVTIETGRISGLEALLRWEHPERGLTNPSKFLHIAEHTGLIDPIGQWVLEEACQQAREWRVHFGDSERLVVSVNLSTKQFFSQPEFVTEILQRTGLDPGCLQLEITERTVMDDAEFSIGKIQMMKGLGIRFAIDDFGTGYSCLHYLKRLPVDCLKIDRSFVEGLGRNPEDEAIVSGTVSLAHALNLKVVAEGVGSAEQLALLRQMDCDMVQGYYIAEPLPSEDVRRLAKEGGFALEAEDVAPETPNSRE